MPCCRTTPLGWCTQLTPSDDSQRALLNFFGQIIGGISKPMVCQSCGFRAACQARSSVFVCEILVKLCFGIRFEMWNLRWEKSGEQFFFWGGGRGWTFLPARKAREISERISGQISGKISEQISETSFQVSRLFLFFGNFVQQSGAVLMVSVRVALHKSDRNHKNNDHDKAS